jgi:hypothetical protein
LDNRGIIVTILPSNRTTQIGTTQQLHGNKITKPGARTKKGAHNGTRTHVGMSKRLDLRIRTGSTSHQAALVIGDISLINTRKKKEPRTRTKKGARNWVRTHVGMSKRKVRTRGGAMSERERVSKEQRSKKIPYSVYHPIGDRRRRREYKQIIQSQEPGTKTSVNS